MLLKTLGHLTLYRDDGTPVAKDDLRRKDLALLAYLCVEGLPVHARGRLAGLLWGESTDDKARASLTNALRRLGEVLPPGVLMRQKETVRWAGDLPCDAVMLLREEIPPGEVDEDFSLYAGDFLEAFDPGRGAQDFCEWADRRRAEIRDAALHLLDRAGAQAEAAGTWERALRLGRKAVKIDPLWEQGHRRIMRALAARGERNIALRHYQELEVYLAAELGAPPDPDTRALAEQLRAPQPAEPSLAPPSPPPPSPVDVPPMVAPQAEASPPAPVPAADPPGGEPDADPSAATDHRSPAPDDPPRVRAEVPAVPADPPFPDSRAPSPPRPRPRAARRWPSPWLLLVLLAALLALMISLALDRQRRLGSAAEPLAAPLDHVDSPTRIYVPPAHGESVRVRGSETGYLAFGDTLYEYPDSSTLCVCTGRHPEVVRQMRRLPRWPRRRLPSVLNHPWIGGTLPVVSDHPSDRTAYVPVGCVLPGVPDPPTLDSIFGPGALGRMLEVPDSVLRMLPRAFVARGHPLRPAGTLIRGPADSIRWITYHGGALEVPDPTLLDGYCRSPDEAIRVTAEEFRYYRGWGSLAPGPEQCPARGRGTRTAACKRPHPLPR